MDSVMERQPYGYKDHQYRIGHRRYPLMFAIYLRHGHDE